MVSYTITSVIVYIKSFIIKPILMVELSNKIASFISNAIE